jgi:glycosyltransferase involved in cell wall biosynthesis
MEEKNNPQISVIMPVYNSEEYLETAIESVLGQTFSNFEFIIIDDASTDSSNEIISKYAKKDKRIRLIRNESNQYIGRALNKAISFASTEILARMDSDDISMPNRLDLQYKTITETQQIAVVGCDIDIMNEKGDSLGIRKYPAESSDLKKSVFRHSPFAHPATMLRKKYVLEFGGYEPNKSPSEDLDLWIKLGSKYEFRSVPLPLFRYRFFSNSHSNRKLKKVELMTIRMRIEAIMKYGYKPTIMDIAYNILQFSTLWFIPAKIRIRMYNFIRNYI